MTRDEFNAYCASLPQTTHVVQWGNSDVWKVGGKLFAVCGWVDGDQPGFTFKASDLAYEVLQDQPGLRPAPYLASRGMKWLQQYEAPGLSDESLREHLKASYDMAVARLTKKLRNEIGPLAALPVAKQGHEGSASSIPSGDQTRTATIWPLRAFMAKRIRSCFMTCPQRFDARLGFDSTFGGADAPSGFRFGHNSSLLTKFAMVARRATGQLASKAVEDTIHCRDTPLEEFCKLVKSGN